MLYMHVYIPSGRGSGVVDCTKNEYMKYVSTVEYK